MKTKLNKQSSNKQILNNFINTKLTIHSNYQDNIRELRNLNPSGEKCNIYKYAKSHRPLPYKE